MCTDPVAEIDLEIAGAPRIEMMTVVIVAEAEMENIEPNEMNHVSVNAGAQMISTSLDGKSVVIVVQAGGLDLGLTRYVLQADCI